MISRAVVLSAVLSMTAVPAAAETINSASCRQDLAATWAKMEEMVGRLKSAARAPQDEKCETYRRHAEVVLHAREVLQRCKTGRDRAGDVAHMDGALDDVNSVIDRECANGTQTINPQTRTPQSDSDGISTR